MTTELQRYESRLSSSQIVKILGDVMDVSPLNLDQPDVWEAMIPRSMLEKVDVFSKFVGLNPEPYVRRNVESIRTPVRPASMAPSSRGGGRGGRIIKTATRNVNSVEDREHEAATKLQSLHRVKLAKRKVQERREMQAACAEIGDSEEVHAAASKLQSLHRVKIAKKEVQRKRDEITQQHDAATKLQSLHRVRIAKREVVTRKDEIAAQHAAATKLQAMHRVKIAKKDVAAKRKEILAEHEAATKLQSLHRVKIAKKDVAAKRKELFEKKRIAEEIGDSEEVHEAASKLQAIQRKRIAAKKAEAESRKNMGELQESNTKRSKKKESSNRKKQPSPPTGSSKGASGRKPQSVKTSIKSPKRFI